MSPYRSPEPVLLTPALAADDEEDDWARATIAFLVVLVAVGVRILEILPPR